MSGDEETKKPDERMKEYLEIFSSTKSYRRSIAWRVISSFLLVRKKNEVESLFQRILVLPQFHSSEQNYWKKTSKMKWYKKITSILSFIEFYLWRARKFVTHIYRMFSRYIDWTLIQWIHVILAICSLFTTHTKSCTVF